MPKREKYDRINWYEIRLAYITREDLPTHRELSEEFDVNVKFISRRSSEENWVKQREDFLGEIEAKVRLERKNELKEKLKVNLNIVRGAIGKIALQMKDNELTGHYSDIDRLMRLEQFLLGEVEERKELSVGVGGLSKEVKDLTREEIYELYGKINDE